MKKTILLLLCAAAYTLAAAEPIMRIGIMSDTHVKADPASCRLLKEALTLFRQKQVDMIANVGDIADVYNVQAYRNYRDTVRSVFPDEQSKPRELFVYANHDIIGRSGESPWVVFRDVKKHLAISNDPYDVVQYKGFPFLILPQFYEPEKYRSMLETALKENPGKPVFIFDHVPPRQTGINGASWGSVQTRELLEGHPRVIHISGHSHGTLANPHLFRQEDFTSVNAGALNYWHSVLIGNIPAILYSDMVLIMEVFDDKVVFRRFFSTTKKEYQPDTPWTVKLPYDPREADFNPARLKQRSTAPAFPADTAITVKPDPRGMRISCPGAVHNDGIYYYKVELFRRRNGQWRSFARRDEKGDFMLNSGERPQPLDFVVSYGYFDAGDDYRVQIAPVHAFGKTGPAIAADFTVPAKPAAKVIFESRSPMTELTFRSGLSGGTPFAADSDGYYVIDKPRINTRLELPPEIWAGARGTRFRFTLDMQTIQTGGVWTLVLRNPTPLKNATNRVPTVPADPGPQRYVMEFSKVNADFVYYLLIREGGTGRIRFDHIKLELLD